MKTIYFFQFSLSRLIYTLCITFFKKKLKVGLLSIFIIFLNFMKLNFFSTTQTHKFLLAFGLVFVFLIPPFQSPDEINHFLKSYHVSEGYMTGIRTADNRLGGYLPSSFKKIIDPFSPLIFNQEKHITPYTIIESFSVPLEKEQTTFFDFPNTAIYAPTAYIPQAAVMSVFKMVNAPPLVLFYLGRLANFMVWYCLILFALKIMPFKQKTMFLLAFLPGSIAINASNNADVVTNGLCFLSIALIIKAIRGSLSPEGVRDVAQLHILSLFVFGLATFLISLNKIVYFPLTFLLFFIPTKRFGNWQKQVGFASFFIVLNVFAILMWQKKIEPLYLKFEEYNPQFTESQTLIKGIDPTAQLNRIIANPLEFIGILPKTIRAEGEGMLFSYLNKFGWDSNSIPILLNILLLIGLLSQIFQDKNELKKYQKIGFLTIGFIMTIAFLMVMYLIWCPVGKDFIWNLQGRYFIPIFIMFFMAIPSSEQFNTQTLQKFMGFKAFFWYQIMVYGFVFYAIVQRYYN
jgi:uncharacterized membrane protein